jgi:gamma-glutamyltranspeptidase/glutathione hydrolase
VTRGAAVASAGAGATKAAEDALEAGGSACDAACAAFLADAGADATVLLSPVVALVAGLGVGARAFDGRAVQPGKDAPRPRGFLDEASAPLAARAAAPRSFGLLSLLHGYRGRLPMRQIAAWGVAAAKKLGAAARSDLLRRFADSGTSAFRRPEILRSLLAAAGTVPGGILGEEDLATATPADVEPSCATRDQTSIVTLPWPVAAGDARVVLAADNRGLVVALAYAPGDCTLAVPELEIALPTVARPVLRGVTRVAPGTPCPAPAPIAALSFSGRTVLVVGVPGASELGAASLERAASAIGFESIVGAIGPGAMAAAWDGERAVVVVPGSE